MLSPRRLRNSYGRHACREPTSSFEAVQQQLPLDHADPRRYPKDMLQVTRLVLYRAMASHSCLLESLTGARARHRLAAARDGSSWLVRAKDAPYPATT
jgi:hypothetical protein